MGLGLGLPCCDCGTGVQPCPSHSSGLGSVGNYCETGAPFTSQYWRFENYAQGSPLRAYPTLSAGDLRFFYPIAQTTTNVYTGASRSYWQNDSIYGNVHAAGDATLNSFRITFDLTTDTSTISFTGNPTDPFISIYTKLLTTIRYGSRVLTFSIVRSGANGLNKEILQLTDGTISQYIKLEQFHTNSRTIVITVTPNRITVTSGGVLVFGLTNTYPPAACVFMSADWYSEMHLGAASNGPLSRYVFPGDGDTRTLHLIENFCIEHFVSAPFWLAYYDSWDFENGDQINYLPTVTGPVVLPPTYSIVSTTALPTGLTISSTTGIISGTINEPSAATGNVIIRLTDGSGLIADSPTYAWRVAAFEIEYQSPYNTTNAPAPITNFDWSFYPLDVVSLPVTTTSGTQPYSFLLVGNLPDGLTLNTTSGNITGTISQTTDSTTGVAVISAIDSEQRAAIATYRWMLKVAFSIVYPSPYSNRGITVPAPYEWGISWGYGVDNYSLFPTVTGGVPPLSFAKLSGSEPPTGSTNALSGEVHGTCGADSTGSYSGRVTDSIGNTADSPVYEWKIEQIVELTIEYPSPYTNTGTAPTGTDWRTHRGTAWDLQCTITGATGATTVTIESGSIGLMAPHDGTTGDITGGPIPGMGGSTGSVVFRVTDSLGHTVTSRTYNWEISGTA